MKLFNITCLGLLSVAISGAFAQSTAATDPARLEFRAIPIEGVTASVHTVTPYRIYDKIVVTVSDPIACGQKPTEPTMKIEGGKVLLSYKLTAASPVAKACTLISEFDVLNAPNQDLEIHFSGGPEPYVVAQMRQCPFYKPATADIWECLMPAAN